MYNNKVETSLNPRDYYPNEVCRIINRTQHEMYIKHGLRPIDMYPSIDKNGKSIVVYIYDRKESYELYQAWCNYELK